MTEDARRFLIIHNPVSGSRNAKRLSKVLDKLEKAGCGVTLAGTEYAGHASKIAAEAVKSGENWSAVVAAGGDGTISEVASGMTDTDIPLGFIPLGTANVLAREVGVGTNLQKAVRTLTSGKAVEIFPGQMGDQRFLLMVGAGYDSLAVSELSSHEKRKYGALAYIFAAVRAVKRFKSLDVRVKVNGEDYRGASVIASRVRLFGGPFTIAPDADLCKPGLHVLILKNRGLWAALKYGAALACNRLWKLSSVDYIRTDGTVEILSDHPTPCQFDGDDGPETPVSLTTDRRKLFLMMP